MDDIFPFLFFGCWNQPGSAPIPRDLVFDHIRSNQLDSKMIMLGGDNVYPRPIPGVKNKKHEIEVFNEGLEMYKTLGKPIFTAFGNHNVIEPVMKKHQMNVFGLTKTYYDLVFGNIHFIILDSNIIGEGPENVEYRPMHIWFEKTVYELPADHLYFLVQHDPYFTARSKGFGELANSDLFLGTLFHRPPIAILCADTHHYQHAIISPISDPSIAIHQFIVGTGGANPDPYMSDFDEHTFRDTYIFKKIEEIAGFGYLRIEGPDARACHFIKVDIWPLAKKGGSRRRRSCRRRHTKRRRSSK